MSTPPTVPRLAALAAAALLLSGCAPAPGPAPEQAAGTAQAGPDASQKPAPAGVLGERVAALLAADRGSADEVAAAFAALATTWDTTADRTETAAVRRAALLMTPELAAATVEPERNSSQGLWNELAGEQAISVPDVQPAGPGEAPPPDTPEVAYRSHQIQWTWQTPDGRHLRDGASVRDIHLALTRTGGKWSVADYTTEELPAPTGSQQDAPRKEANE